MVTSSKGWDMFSQPPTSTSSLNSREEEADEECREQTSFGNTDLARHGNGDISLREWLDRPGRSVDQVECLHIFGQVVEAAGVAHSQSVVVTNIRPSCFVMTALSKVSFIESASSSGSEDFPEKPLTEAAQLAGAAAGFEEKKNFPLKEILHMELKWYTSPEEDSGASSTFSSDVYRLGVLLFELFCVFDTLDEKLRTMSNLRHRLLPPQLLLKWPKVASFCLWLLHPRQESRPKISEVIESELFNEMKDSLEEREAAIKLREETADQELLLEFLSELQQRKQEAADKLHDTISVISADVEEVVKQKLKTRSYSELLNSEHSPIDKGDKPFLYPETNGDSSCSGSRKRSRTGYWKISGRLNENQAESPRPEAYSDTKERVLSKSSRLMKNFKKLEAAYFSSRGRMIRPEGKLSRNITTPRSSKGSTVKTEGSSVNKEGFHGGKCQWVDPFLEGLCSYLAFSKLDVRADLKQGDLMNSSNLVCALAFDRDQEYFATAGVSRKIKIFECDMLLDDEHDTHYPVVEMASRSKLSSICWNSYIKSQIASSDFQGVVQVWDVSRSQVFVEMKEHERRVWSVDFSPTDPTKLASGSDDGTVKLWNINQAIGGSIGSITTKANVCSVQFPPDSSHLLAVGSADHNVYCYDLRNLRVPLLTLVGHTKTVSYVKFVDSTTLVSASTDSSLRLWDLTSRILDKPIETFTGHTNTKNFVGLSISDGYISTGSETNEVFVYHKAFPMPALSYKFNCTDPISGREAEDAAQFVSCVCWRGQSSTLVAANSSGNIKILEMA
ncbi:protein SPA1-RELATED 3-like [Iris pallida]|uniref:Protein SPA1-RELATED 3-like n=1 Tax=Iris pallida TaxID=29817 RepID=A0AAX6DQF0_IRIPA|nr:protein SPA1-RELATED 3-like [Iris pallida]